MNHLLNSHPGSEKIDSFGNEIRNDSSEIEDFETHFSPCSSRSSSSTNSITSSKSYRVEWDGMGHQGKTGR